jgi:toxin ParE1/3/4
MTAGSYRLTPAAQRDLASIWDYTEENGGVAQAEAYLGDLREAIERIAKDPLRGRSCEAVRVGYRRYVSGSHLIFYRVQGHGVDVIRILHQRMDIDQRL